MTTEVTTTTTRMLTIFYRLDKETKISLFLWLTACNCVQRQARAWSWWVTTWPVLPSLSSYIKGDANLQLSSSHAIGQSLRGIENMWVFLPLTFFRKSKCGEDDDDNDEYIANKKNEWEIMMIINTRSKRKAEWEIKKDDYHDNDDDEYYVNKKKKNER